MWIESHQALRDHPKTRKLAALLGVHRMQAIGHLHALWWWALDYAEDGDLSPFDTADIALAADWDGDPDMLIDALRNCGFAEKPGFLDTDCRIHDWYEYAGRLLERRRQDRERKRAARATSAGRPADATRTSGRRDAEIGRTAHVPTDRPSEPTPTELADGPPTKNQPSARSVASCDEIEAEFDGWYAAYPKRSKPDAARRAWRKAREHASAEQLTYGLRASIEAWENQGLNRRYMPNAARWLDDGEWKNDHATLTGRNHPDPDVDRQPPYSSLDYDL